MVSRGFCASLHRASPHAPESFRMSLFPSLVDSSTEDENGPATQADVSDWMTHLYSNMALCRPHHLRPRP